MYQGNPIQSVVSTEPIKMFERTARDIGIDEREIPIIAKLLEELRKLGCDGFEHAFRRRIEGTYFTSEGNQKDHEFDIFGFGDSQTEAGKPSFYGFTLAAIEGEFR